MRLSNFGLGSLLALSLTMTAYAQEEERPQEEERQPPVTEEAQGEGAAIVPEQTPDNSAQFRALDADENGQLSVAEAGRVAAIAEIFSTLDSNQDEQLSAEEFARMPSTN